jgi:PAS domain S-box-containing protein
MWELPLLLLGVGDYDGNYRHLNQAYQQVLGWSAAELKSVPWWEFLHPDERDELTETAQQLMEHGQVRFGDTVRMLCRNGRYKWVRWNTAIDPERGLFYSAPKSATTGFGSARGNGTWPTTPSPAHPS